MQSEEFDKKVVEAAEHHRPVYSEKAWKEMNKLLDQHLPEKKDDRRRILFFLLLLLCLGGGGVWLITGKSPGKQPVANTATTGKEKSNDIAAKTNTPVPDERNAGNIQAGNLPAGEAPVQNTNTNLPASTTLQRSPGTKTEPILTYKNNKGGFTDNNGETNLSLTAGGGNRKVKGKTENRSAIIPIEPAKNEEKSTISVAGAPLEPAANNTVVTNVTPVKDHPSAPPMAEKKDIAINKPADKKPEEKTSVADKKETPAATNPIRLRPKNRFDLALTVSAGPDVSSVGFARPGKLRPVYGAGISLSYGKNFSISTGYYSVRKIYKAGATDYKFPYLPSNYSYLYEIDANCKVTEIPLTLTWNFKEEGRGNWFFSAGASSFLMKRETYDYLYKYPSGQVQTYTKVFGNKNQHIFSVVSLSGGYRKNISNSVFVSAEQYFKIPTGGVGAGKIDLNSTGLLFTIGIRPFQPPAKKNK
jgi:hypothetical protein